MSESIEHQATSGASRAARSPKTDASADTDLGRALKRIDIVTRLLGGWIWETHAQHRFIYMSPSVVDFAGRSPEWHYAKTRQDLGNMSLQTADGRSWVEQLEKRQPFGPVDFIRYQAGGALVMRSIGTPLFDTSGTFTGYCGVAFSVPSEQPAEVVDRRGETRRKVVRAGEIISTGDATPVSCVVLDLSPSGARIRLPGEVELSATFRLVVASLSLERNAEVRWRRSDEIGVEFKD